MTMQLLEEEDRNIHNYDQLEVALNQDLNIVFAYSLIKKCLKKFWKVLNITFNELNNELSTEKTKIWLLYEYWQNKKYLG